MERYKCPCCGFYTFESDSRDGPLFDYCEVCSWQYDPVAHNKPDSLIGANGITLNTAKLNFLKYEVAKPEYKSRVRKPQPEELSENN